MRGTFGAVTAEMLPGTRNMAVMFLHVMFYAVRVMFAVQHRMLVMVGVVPRTVACRARPMLTVRDVAVMLPGAVMRMQALAVTLVGVVACDVTAMRALASPGVRVVFTGVRRPVMGAATVPTF